MSKLNKEVVATPDFEPSIILRYEGAIMKYPETVLLTAFNKRFIEGKTITAISYELGVDRKYLSKVMLGHKRKEIKQRWDSEQVASSSMYPAAKRSAIFTFFQVLGLPFRKKA